MKVRKVAVVGGFAVGAALSFAPLASATPTDPLISVVDSEISAENSLFQFEALLAGDYNDITHTTTPGTFDGFLTDADSMKDAPYLDSATEASKVTPLEYELYGVNPIAADMSYYSGPFNEFNGALTEFYNAYNVELFSLLNPNADIASIPLGDLSGPGIDEALAFGTGAGAAGDFLTDGWNDLLGFFGVFS